MSVAILSNKSGQALGRLIHDMLASVRDYWVQAEAYQKFIYLIAGIFVVSGLFHSGVGLATSGSWEGDISWRKPIIFSFSFGVTCLSLGWVMTFLPKRQVIGWLLMGIFGLTSLAEVFLISMQQWRGVPSHFNLTTPFDEAVFGWMGMMVNFIALVILIITLWALFALRASASFGWAIRVGLILLVAGQVLGYLIVSNGTTQLMEQTGQAPNIFGVAGVMKMPHAIALHGIQILPFLAWILLFTTLSDSRRTQMVAIASGGYIGLVLVSTWQTFSGLAPFDLNLIASLILGLSATLLGGVYMAAFLSLVRKQLSY